VKRNWIFPVLSLVCLVLLVGCLGPSALVPAAPPTPAPYEEPEIPSNFTTYTEEGLFSISYPSDWQPATSIMGEIFEETKQMMEASVPLVSLEGINILFMAGSESLDGYYPAVTVLTEKREAGYWTLDEVYEANSRYDKAVTPGYKELSITKTVIDAREAIIAFTEDNEPGYGRWRYLNTFTVKDDFVWLVGCSCEHQDFRDYEETFESVVRSLRILN